MANQPHFLGSMTLKALLEEPHLKNPPLVLQSGDHIKKEGDIPQINYGSAFLGPNLWDKSFGNIDFNLQYMDLDEFLSENGIADEEEAEKNTTPALPTKEEVAVVANNNKNNAKEVNSNQPNSPQQYLRTPPMSPQQFLAQAGPSSPISQFPPHQGPNISPSNPINAGSSPGPGSPFTVEFQVSDQDLALSSIPDYTDGYRPKWQLMTKNTSGSKCNNGEKDFDPRKKQFSDEELKPQPIIKKSKKVFVPDGLKDDKYWARRHKNNYAAKRSRDARRVKENQIAMRASFLEKENHCLREEVKKLRKENAKLRSSKTNEKYVAPVEQPSSGPSSPLSITALAFS